MNVKITPSQLSGKIKAPASKSFAHRIILSAFLSGEKCVIDGVGNSKDVLATLSALRDMGANSSLNDGVCEIERVNRKNSQKINCIESGSTLRFLIPVACALGLECEFTGEGRLLERPIKELTDVLNENGGKIVGHKITGKLKSGEYKINATVSSQFISGLMFALPIIDGDSKIVLQGNAVSKGYLDITIEVLSKFNIKIEKTDFGYNICGNQKYVMPNKIKVEGDFSGAAFLLSSGAINNSITVSGLNANSTQGDAKILDVLSKFGAKVSCERDEITITANGLKGIEYDCEDIPDLVQIISVVASFAEGKTVLKNVERLRLKESDRIKAIIDMLTIAGIRVEIKDNDLIVYGGKVNGGEFDGGNDHRTVMSSAILSLYASGSSKIVGAQVVDKSYPEFFSDLIKLGGNVDVDI